MNLIASLVVRNELGRYLELCVEHLLEFCDRIVVLDDASDDGTFEWLADHASDQLLVDTTETPNFYVHEGRKRQRLLDLTLGQHPSHVLQLDADEFVSDGVRLRNLLEANPSRPVWTLTMQEIWGAGDQLAVREDGGWRSHPVPVLWQAPPYGPDRKWRIRDRALACGREPVAVLSIAARARDTDVDLLHFGWTDEAARQARFDRYVQADNGRYHASRHLESIMWPDDRVTVTERPWPAGVVFDRLRDRFATSRAVKDAVHALASEHERVPGETNNILREIRDELRRK